MRTFGLFVAGFVVGTVIFGACGKKVESAPTPVNPQITDAVTQAASPVVDAGVVTTEGKMEAGTPVVQSVGSQSAAVPSQSSESVQSVPAVSKETSVTK
jgi:hypothetical protein